MKDRVPANPGRVLITPENGSAAFYATMTRADNPTQEGDPLNKTTLLKDATATLFGLGADAVPDDVLAAIHASLNGNTNDISALKASRAKIESGSYAGTGSGGKTLTFSFVPKIVIINGGTDNAYGYYTCQYLMIVPCIGLKSEGITNACFWGDSSTKFGSSQYTTVSLSGSTLTLSGGSEYAMNASSRTYHYIAFA